MSWDVKALKRDVGLAHGLRQVEKLKPCLNSITDRLGYAEYHFSEFHRLLGIYQEGTRTEPEVIADLFRRGEDGPSEFQLSRSQAGAHVVAFLQSIHSLSDIFSHVIYYALAMNKIDSLRLAPRRISLRSVTRRLETERRYGTLSTTTEALIDNTDYQYLEAIVNHSKHRSVVRTGYTVKLIRGVEERWHGLEFKEFEYDGTAYPRRWVDEYLKGEYDRQVPLIVQMGNKLNRLVEAELPPQASS